MAGTNQGLWHGEVGRTSMTGRVYSSISLSLSLSLSLSISIPRSPSLSLSHSISLLLTVRRCVVMAASATCEQSTHNAAVALIIGLPDAK